MLYDELLTYTVSAYDRDFWTMVQVMAQRSRNPEVLADLWRYLQPHMLFDPHQSRDYAYETAELVAANPGVSQETLEELALTGCVSAALSVEGASFNREKAILNMVNSPRHQYDAMAMLCEETLLQRDVDQLCRLFAKDVSGDAYAGSLAQHQPIPEDGLFILAKADKVSKELIETLLTRRTCPAWMMVEALGIERSAVTGGKFYDVLAKSSDMTPQARYEAYVHALVGQSSEVDEMIHQHMLGDFHAFKQLLAYCVPFRNDCSLVKPLMRDFLQGFDITGGATVNELWPYVHDTLTVNTQPTDEATERYLFTWLLANNGYSRGRGDSQRQKLLRQPYMTAERIASLPQATWEDSFHNNEVSAMANTQIAPDTLAAWLENGDGNWSAQKWTRRSRVEALAKLIAFLCSENGLDRSSPRLVDWLFKKFSRTNNYQIKRMIAQHPMLSVPLLRRATKMSGIGTVATAALQQRLSHAHHLQPQSQPVPGRTAGDLQPA